MKMPFGKHKGRPLKDVPDDYLLWVVDNCKSVSPTLLQAIKVRLEVESPEPSAKAKRQQQPNTEASNAAIARAKAELNETQRELRVAQDELQEAKRRLAEREAVVTKWFRKASFQFHPHRGGSHEVQVLINDLKNAFDSC